MTGFVYAIESHGAVKIGYTRHPFVRMHALNHASPFPLTLLGFVKGSQQQENALHALLKPYRIRGEWYRKAGPVLHFIDLLPPPCTKDEFAPRFMGSLYQPVQPDSAVLQ